MKYLRKKDVVARSVAGENILVPIHGCTRNVYTLNSTGSRLWDLLDTACTEDELTVALSERYRLPKEAVSADVRSFLADMKSMELVTELP
jgi:hypothetical protein